MSERLSTPYGWHELFKWHHEARKLFHQRDKTLDLVNQSASELAQKAKIIIKWKASQRLSRPAAKV